MTRLLVLLLVGLAWAATPGAALSVIDGPRAAGDAWAFIVLDDAQGLAVEADAPIRLVVAAPADARPTETLRRAWSADDLPRGPWRGVEDATRVVVTPDGPITVRLLDAGGPRAGIAFDLPGPAPASSEPASGPRSDAHDSPDTTPVDGAPPDAHATTDAAAPPRPPAHGAAAGPPTDPAPGPPDPAASRRLPVVMLWGPALALALALVWPRRRRGAPASPGETTPEPL